MTALRDDSHLPSIVTDGKRTIIDANPALQQLTGYRLPELKGMLLDDLVRHEDRAIIEKHFSALPNGAPSGTIVRLHTKGGFTLYVTLATRELSSCEFLTTITNNDDRLSDNELNYRSRYALALYEIGRQMVSSFDAEEVLKLVVKNVAWLLECNFAAVAQVDWETGELTYREVMGDKTDLAASRSSVQGPSIAGRVTVTQKPLIADSVLELRHESGSDFEVLAKEGLKSAFGVPITNKGKKFGALIVGFRSDHKITGDEVDLTTHLANQAALALGNATLYQQSVEYSKSMAALTSRLTVIQEEERRRITRELHDGIGQALTGLRLNLDLLSRQVPIVDGPAADRVVLMRQVIDETLNTIRQIAFDLRPPILDDLGLISALRVYVDRYEERTKIPVALTCPEHLKRFDPKVEATLYRVIQEALTNVAKHSGAKNVRIEIKRADHTLGLTIIDDGKGFDKPRSGEPGLWSSGLGIINMKERIDGLGGEFSMMSQKGRGTTIKIDIPIHER